MATSTSPGAALASSSAAASSPAVRRSARQRAAASTVVEAVEWTVGIDALSPELLVRRANAWIELTSQDRIVAEVAQGHKGPATRRIYRELAEVSHAFADAALRRLWRRIVVDLGKKRSKGVRLHKDGSSSPTRFSRRSTSSPSDTRRSGGCSFGSMARCRRSGRRRRSTCCGRSSTRSSSRWRRVCRRYRARKRPR